ncbi:MAG: YeeE/YedE family protein [Kofleriaceae bacterium]
MSDSIVPALAGGALIGLAASIALVAHGRIAGISGTLGRAITTPRDHGQRFRVPFLGAMIATGIIAALISPRAIGAPIRGVAMLALAGLLVGVGTTLANGCTSGHGVCGLSRGSRRSLVAVVTFMVTAAVTVALFGAQA